MKPQWVSGASCTLLIGLSVLLFWWLPGPPFRLEQFDLPKDLALGVLGLACALQLVFRGEVPWESAIDAPVAIFLCWGAALTLLVAMNVDVAWRTVGGFSAATSFFFLSRRVGATPGSGGVYMAICIPLFVFAALVLLEAFGGIPFISAPGRRPGATLGNRNLAARVACMSLPLLWRQLVLSDRRAIQRIVPVMIAVTIAVIALSRSRAALLTTVGLVIAIPVATWCVSDGLLTQRTRVASQSWLTAVLIGGLLAVLLPNRLSWGPRDFASSALGVIDYQAGTGRGRVIQAQTTARIIRAAPLQGVGPGNWSIVYPAYARLDDPSLNLGAFYPAPRVPRNEVLGLTAEFGAPGLALGLSSVIALLARAMAMLRRSDVVTQQSGLMALGVLASAAVLGLFDSIVRVAPTALLLALLVGLALGEGSARGSQPRKVWAGRHFARRAIMIGYACASLIFARSAFQDVAAFRIIRSTKTIEDLDHAVMIAPHNVEARMLLAYVLAGADRCDLARPHLTQAARLQPFSGAVRTLLVQCDNALSKP